MRLSVALLPAVDPDEVLVYVENIDRQCQRIIDLMDELETTFESPPHTALLDPSLLTPPPAGEQAHTQ